MRKKYTYYVNNEVFSRKDFMAELEKYCMKVIGTEVLSNGIGIETCEFDQKAFNRKMRQIDNGNILVDFNCNKIFRRKEVKC
jgi:hypothetical protein